MIYFILYLIKSLDAYFIHAWDTIHKQVIAYLYYLVILLLVYNQLIVT